MAVWIKNGRSKQGWIIFAQGERSVNEFWAVSHHGRAKGLMIWAEGEAADLWSYAAPEPELDTWHHLGVTWDGNNYAFYYDGALVASGTHRPFNTRSSGAFYGGGGSMYQDCGDWPPCWFKGEASDLRYWNRALSASEVAYYQGLPRTLT